MLVKVKNLTKNTLTPVHSKTKETAFISPNEITWIDEEFLLGGHAGLKILERETPPEPEVKPVPKPPQPQQQPQNQIKPANTQTPSNNASSGQNSPNQKPNPAT